MKVTDIQLKIRETLESPGWQVILQDFKELLVERYKVLLDIKPKKLEEMQRDIKSRVVLIQRIYRLAGLEWRWDKYKDMSAAVGDEELTREQQLYKNYLEELQGADNGRNN